MSEPTEVMVAGPPGITYEASWGRRPPRKSTTWWAGVVHERVDGGGMELWSCEHRHQAEARARACAVAWATEKARQELVAHEPPPGLPELRVPVGQMFAGMPVVFDDPWDEPERRLTRIARDLVNQAVMTAAQRLGWALADRPARGTGRLVRDAEPAGALAVLRAVELAAREEMRSEIPRARVAGMSWVQVGVALGLGDDRMTAGELAFDLACPPDSKWARDYGQSITWQCGSCGGQVKDMWVDGESGHANGCERHVRELAARDGADGRR